MADGRERTSVRRVVVVLGYSDSGAGSLHPVCAQRLEHASRLTSAADVVVLSGWARRPHTPSEAGLMQAAWHGPAARVIVDEDARTTAENAANTVADILATGAEEVVVVTSSWHARRARAAFRWLLRGTGIRVVVDAPRSPSPTRSILRELALWPVLPVQLRRARTGLPGRPGRG